MASSSAPTTASTEPQTIKGLDASFEFTEIVTVYKYIVYACTCVSQCGCSVQYCTCMHYIHLYNVHVHVHVCDMVDKLTAASLYVLRGVSMFQSFADVYVHVHVHVLVAVSV